MNSIKTILLIGSTGSGKSTLANVLLGKKDESGNFKEIFGESAGSVSETKKVQIEEFEKGSIRYRIVDTVGIGDTGMTRDVVLRKLALMGYSVRDGLSQILFVTNGGITNEAKSTYDLLSKIIFDENIAEYTTVVRTGFVHFGDEKKCQEEKERVVEKNKILGELIEGGNGIIYTDNPPVNVIKDEELIILNKKRRKASRKILLDHLENVCQDNIYKPNNLDDLNREIGRYMKEKKELKEKEKRGIIRKARRIIKNKSLNERITKKMIEFIGKIHSTLREEIEIELKLKDKKPTEWRWFKSYKLKIREELRGRLEEIEKKWSDTKKNYVEFLDEEMTKKIEKLVYKADIENKKKGDKISNDLKCGIKVLLRIQEEGAKEKKVSSSYQSLKDYALGEFSKKVDAEGLKEICEFKSRSVIISAKSDEITDKIKKSKEVLNSNSETIEKQKKEIDELEEKCWKIEEECLQTKIKIIEEKLFLESNELMRDKLNSELLTLKTKIIIKKTVDFLKNKRNFLEKRKENINKLGKYYNDLYDFVNTEYAKQTIRTQFINDVGDAVDFGINIYGTNIRINPIKMMGAVVTAENELKKISYFEEISNKFNSCLGNDTSTISALKGVYESLINICEKNEELKISAKIVDVLKLEIKSEKESVVTLKTFEVRHSKVFSIFSNWKKEYLTLGEMKEELRSLDDNLKELKEELDREENLFEKVKKDHEKKELTNQIQISPKR